MALIPLLVFRIFVEDCLLPPALKAEGTRGENEEREGCPTRDEGEEPQEDSFSSTISPPSAPPRSQRKIRGLIKIVCLLGPLLHSSAVLCSRQISYARGRESSSRARDERHRRVSVESYSTRPGGHGRLLIPIYPVFFVFRTASRVSRETIIIFFLFTTRRISNSCDISIYRWSVTACSACITGIRFFALKENSDVSLAIAHPEIVRWLIYARASVPLSSPPFPYRGPRGCDKLPVNKLGSAQGRS